MKKTLDDVLFDVDDYVSAAKRNVKTSKVNGSVWVVSEDPDETDKIESDLKMKFGDYGPKVKRATAKTVAVTPR